MTDAGAFQKPVRVRVFFLNCPSLDIAACSYLIAAQNTVQRVFEFEIYDFSVYLAKTREGPTDFTSRFLELLTRSRVPGRRWATRRYRSRQDRIAIPGLGSSIPLDTWFPAIRETIRAHDSWLSQLPEAMAIGASIRVSQLS